MKTSVKLIERTEALIMNHQKNNGFETIFDFINEDLAELKEILSTPKDSEQSSLKEMAKEALEKCSIWKKIEDKDLTKRVIIGFAAEFAEFYHKQQLKETWTYNDIIEVLNNATSIKDAICIFNEGFDGNEGI